MFKIKKREHLLSLKMLQFFGVYQTFPVLFFNGRKTQKVLLVVVFSEHHIVKLTL